MWQHQRQKTVFSAILQTYCWASLCWASPAVAADAASHAAVDANGRGAVVEDWLSDEENLLRAIDAAETLDDSRQEWLRTTLTEQRRHVRKAIDSPGAVVVRARGLFEYLRQRVLTGPYAAQGHAVVEALSGGQQNCLSATVVFALLAPAAGLDVRAVAWPEHVTIRLQDEAGREWNLEVTASQWTLLGAAADARGPGRVLPKSGLAALVHFNRACDDFSKHDWEASLWHLERALGLDEGNPATRRNWVAVQNALGVQALVAKDFDAAYRRLDAAWQLAQQDGQTHEQRVLRHNLLAVCQRWTEELARLNSGACVLVPCGRALLASWAADEDCRNWARSAAWRAWWGAW